MGDTDVGSVWGWAKIYPKEKNHKTIFSETCLFSVLYFPINSRWLPLVQTC